MKKVVSLDKKAKLIGCNTGISLFFVIVVILSHIIKVEEGVEYVWHAVVLTFSPFIACVEIRLCKLISKYTYLFLLHKKGEKNNEY